MEYPYIGIHEHSVYSKNICESCVRNVQSFACFNVQTELRISLKNMQKERKAVTFYYRIP